MINPGAISSKAISDIAIFKKAFSQAICNETNIMYTNAAIDALSAICKDYGDLGYLFVYNEKTEGAIYSIGNMMSMWLRLQDNKIQQVQGEGLYKIFGMYESKTYRYFDVFEAISVVENYFNAMNTICGVTK